MLVSVVSSGLNTKSKNIEAVCDGVIHACPLDENRKEREQQGYIIGYADEARAHQRIAGSHLQSFSGVVYV